LICHVEEITSCAVVSTVCLLEFEFFLDTYPALEKKENVNVMLHVARTKTEKNREFEV